MHYVVIGNGAAGVGAAEAIRQADAEDEITLVGDEVYHVYSRPLIAHFLAGEVTEPEVAFRPADFYQRNRIVTRLGVKASGLDVVGRRLTLSDGSILTYDRLLIATGSTQTFPPLPGADLPGVCNFWTLDHAKSVLARIQPETPAIVVGAGLIGLQAAHGLHGAGAKVTIVELLPHILGRILDKEGALLAQSVLKTNGIDVRTSQSVARIEGNSEHGVTGVDLANGEHLPCAVVIKATGVRPNLGLIKDTPIKAEMGILVDEHFQTNVPGIYAAGDVAETRNLAADEDTYVNANWPNANAQGRIAGLNMAGQTTDYPGSLSMSSLPIFGMPIFSLGIVEPDEDKDYHVKFRRGVGIYQKLVFRGNRLAGGVFVGEAPDVGMLNDLIQRQMSLALIKDAILEQKQQAYLFRRAMAHDKMEGVDVSWRESLGDTETYEKLFNVDKWQERERDERKWRPS